MQMGIATQETEWRFFKKLKIERPYETALPRQGICPDRMKQVHRRDTCVSGFIFSLWSQLPCGMFLITEEWTESQMNSPSILPVHKERGQLTCRGMPEAGEHCPSALSQTRKDRCWMSAFLCGNLAMKVGSGCA